MFRTRLPQIAAQLAPRLDAAATTAAELVEQNAKDRVPVLTGRLRDAIHIEHTGPGEIEVIAGSEEVFYGHIVEHGSIHTPPHPFMVPAAEQARGKALALGRAAMRNL